MWRPVNDVGQAKHLSSFSSPHTLLSHTEYLSLSWGRTPRGGQIWMTHIRLVRGGGVKKGLKKCTAPRSTFHNFF